MGRIRNAVPGPLPGLAILTSLTLALVPAPDPAAAQVIVGTAVDVAGEAGLPGVAVTLLDSGDVALITFVSDSTGRFALTPPAAGVYSLRAERLGYTMARTGKLTVGEGEIVLVELRLAAEAIVLEPLRVVARERDWMRARDMAEYYERIARYAERGLHVGRIFPREELARMDGWTYAQFMDRRAPLMGSRERCAPVVYWNGMLRTPDDLMSVHDIEGMEFYRGFGPAEMRFSNPCGGGVILVWSRPLAETARPFSWVTAAIAATLLSVFLVLGR